MVTNISEIGGIGRRAGLRNQCLTAWRFKSSISHILQSQCMEYCLNSLGGRIRPAVLYGGVSEWLKEVVLKTIEVATLPGVRIPPPPSNSLCVCDCDSHPICGRHLRGVHFFCC